MILAVFTYIAALFFCIRLKAEGIRNTLLASPLSKQEEEIYRAKADQNDAKKDAPADNGIPHKHLSGEAAKEDPIDPSNASSLSEDALKRTETDCIRQSKRRIK